MQLVPPPGRIARGRVRFRGRRISPASTPNGCAGCAARRLAMVIANPQSELNPLLTVGQQIANVRPLPHRATGKPPAIGVWRC